MARLELKEGGTKRIIGGEGLDKGCSRYWTKK